MLLTIIQHINLRLKFLCSCHSSFWLSLFSLFSCAITLILPCPTWLFTTLFLLHLNWFQMWSCRLRTRIWILSGWVYILYFITWLIIIFAGTFRFLSVWMNFAIHVLLFFRACSAWSAGWPKSCCLTIRRPCFILFRWHSTEIISCLIVIIGSFFLWLLLLLLHRWPTFARWVRSWWRLLMCYASSLIWHIHFHLFSFISK